MFSIVHTAEGWVVRSESGRDVAGPFVSALDAGCEQAELEYEAARDADISERPLLDSEPEYVRLIDISL